MNLPDRFINYRREWDALKQKWQKIPCDSQGHSIDPHTPDKWLTHDVALQYATWDEQQPQAPYGVGFVLNGDGWFFYDLDDCLDTANGVWKPWAASLFTSFTGAWGEASTSGNGLHVIGRCDPASLANRRHKWGKDQGQEQEFYTDKRFVALSRDGLQPIGGTLSDKDWTRELQVVVPERPSLGELPDGRDPSYTGPEDDGTLIEQMLRSKSKAAAFGEGVTIKDLWEANVPVLAKHYGAHEKNQDFDHSSADAALMSHLAFWTGKDMPRMDRLFRRSALMRDKYEKRADYRRNTVQNAARLCSSVYDRSPRDTSDLTACHADMSHDQLAETIYMKRWADNMRYIPEIDRWAEWNGKRWRLAQNGKEQITRLRQDLRDIPGASDAAKRRRLGDNKTIMAVNALMKTNKGATKHLPKWDADPFILGTPTQVVDLRTGETRPRRTTDYLLRSTHYDPAPHETKPALWMAYLETITAGDLEFQGFIQRLCGYAATGSTKEHRLFFAYGSGRNGKGTLLDTLYTILSEDYAAVIPPKLLLDKKTEQHSTDLAHLDGARFARASELPVGKVWDDALLKQITGGDRITARKMRQDNFTFVPQCTLIVDANNAPSVRGIDEAFRRRMCVIPFDVTITEAQMDCNLKDKLIAEASAILRWVIEGAVKWHQNGLQIPERIITATNAYLEDEDTFGAFLEEFFDHVPDAKETNASIHKQFQIYMSRLGLPAWSHTTLSKEMRKRGFAPFKSGGIRGFHGLSLKSTAQKFPQLP